MKKTLKQVIKETFDKLMAMEDKELKELVEKHKGGDIAKTIEYANIDMREYEGGEKQR